MKRSFLSLRWVLPLAVVLPIGYRAAAWLFGSDTSFTYDAAMAAEGKELFAHVWQPNDPLSAGGDGLGPIFNAQSCVACHNQGGSGGGGPLENNVTAFTVVSAKPVKSSSFDVIEAALPLRESRGGVVHAFATANDFRETLSHLSSDFPATSQPNLKDLLPRIQSGCVIAPNIGFSPGIDVSQRNTPALFGASLIDSIPDRVIIAQERAQRVKWGLTDPRTEAFPVGRALRLAKGGVGKFGWKAQIGTLSDFVRAACANELGLGNPSNAQPASMAKPNYKAPGIDLTDAQCDQITAFVASLPQPIEVQPADDLQAKRIAAGNASFSAIGCADCHSPDLGSVKGIYSDLLIHSMGKQLIGGGSYGEPPAELPEFPEGSGPLASEWRTPPLWGVADSAPYMHDGRAVTLEDAVALHGGQAQKSADHFAKLSKVEQESLVAFLKSLRAPQADAPEPAHQFAARNPGETIVPAEAR